MTTTYIQLTQEQLDNLAARAAAETVKISEAQKRAHLIGKVEYYTAEQAAAMIGVTVETIRRYSRQKRLKRRGGTSTAQYHVDDIEMFVWQRNGHKK